MGKTCPFAILLNNRYSGIIIVIIVALIAGGAWYRNTLRNTDLDFADVVIEDVTPEDLELHIIKGKPGVLEFYTKSCPFCVKIEQELKQLKANYGGQIFVVKINAEVHSQKAVKHDIRGVPTLVFFDSEGKSVGSLAGYRNFEEIVETLVGLDLVKQR